MNRPRPGLWAAIGLNLALLTVAVSVLDAGVFFLVTRRMLDEAATDLAVDTATVLAGQLGGAGPDGWKRVIEAHRRSGTRELSLYGASGVLLAGESAPAPPGVRAAFFTREVGVDEEGGDMRVIAPVGAPGPPAAVLVVRIPRTATASPAWAVIGAHAVFSAGLIGLFGLTLFRGSLLRPIARMREGTRRIAAGELGLRVTVEGPAEVADLAESLNAMSAALAEYRSATAEQLARLESANAELLRTQDALLRSEKLASVGRLAAGLAHELGNPLTAVRGFIEILSLGGVQGSEEIVERCQREVERVHIILRSLLDFARQESREVVEVDVRELLGEAARTVQLQARFREIAVRVAVEGEVALRGEPGRLHQVLVNLLLNAADAGARNILLLGESDGREVRLACRDDGEGIVPELLPRLFEPFFTTRAPGKGTGLGLAVSHRILEQHGGRIDVRSAPGAGSLFTLRIPVGGAEGVAGA